MEGVVTRWESNKVNKIIPQINDILGYINHVWQLLKCINREFSDISKQKGGKLASKLTPRKLEMCLP